jgi:hypothetical protein
MMACLGKTEAMDLEANPEEMQSEASIWLQGATVSRRKGPGKIVDLRRNWLPPAGR